MPKLQKPFRDYNELSNTQFDWGEIDDDAIAEYANHFAREGQWLLPIELQLVAMVRKTTVIFKADAAAIPETLNPGRAKVIYAQFDPAKRHFERMTPPALIAVEQVGISL